MGSMRAGLKDTTLAVAMDGSLDIQTAAWLATRQVVLRAAMTAKSKADVKVEKKVIEKVDL